MLETDASSAFSRWSPRRREHVYRYSSGITGKGVQVQRSEKNTPNLNRTELSHHYAPPKKKTRASTSSAPDSDAFTEDDVAGLDGLLGSDRVSSADDRTSDAECETHGKGGEDDEEEEEEGALGEEDDTLPVIQDEEMITEEAVSKTKTKTKATSRWESATDVDLSAMGDWNHATVLAESDIPALGIPHRGFRAFNTH
ncbi:hypothetical protein B0H10DRAFT_2228955 [Mycena sp. CBHHK59/15]|nr:hypothetical protein B0H10DRAFT_2228955 [Mycena sp. CBHHK59/15]